MKGNASSMAKASFVENQKQENKSLSVPFYFLLHPQRFPEKKANLSRHEINCQLEKTQFIWTVSATTSENLFSVHGFLKDTFNLVV